MDWSVNMRGEAPVSQTVVEAVAETAGVDTTALPPLYYYVDPDALDSLFEPRQASVGQSITTEFRYYGFLVTVTADDGVTITVEEHSKSAPRTTGVDVDVEQFEASADR